MYSEETIDKIISNFSKKTGYGYRESRELFGTIRGKCKGFTVNDHMALSKAIAQLTENMATHHYEHCQ